MLDNEQKAAAEFLEFLDFIQRSPAPYPELNLEKHIKTMSDDEIENVVEIATLIANDTVFHLLRKYHEWMRLQSGS